MNRSSAKKFESPNDPIRIDALIILGGGVDKHGQVPTWIDARIAKTEEEWNTGKYSKIIATGKGRADFAHTEAEAMANQLVVRGVHRAAILIEPLSTSTIENAYFSRVLDVDPLHMHSLRVVTNEFHSERAGAIFQHVFHSDYFVDIVTSDDSGIAVDDLELLKAADIEQADFLRNHIFNRMLPGDMEALHNFTYDPTNPLAAKWVEYKAMSQTYAAVSEIMTKSIIAQEQRF